jgi:hypothetical protein
MIWSVVVESFRERQPYLAGRIVKEELKSIAIPHEHYTHILIDTQDVIVNRVAPARRVPDVIGRHVKAPRQLILVSAFVRDFGLTCITSPLACTAIVVM